MAGEIELATYKDTLIVLATAALVAPAAARLKVSPIIAFLVAGFVLSPKMLGAVAGSIPVLSAATIGSPEGVAAVAEIGIVFLLFLIGLELSFERLLLMRRLVFGMGSLQVLLCGVPLGLIALATGQKAGTAIVLGAALALSSTAIVVELLSRQKRLTSGTGRASFSILLLQDLAIVPVILLVGILSRETSGAPATGILLALAQGAAGLVAIVLAGRLLLRPLFRLAATTGTSDTFIAAAVLVAVGTGVATASLGLSMALGAFTAGLLLAETEYRRALEMVIEPFKSLLLGVFFFSVGLKIDPATLVAAPVAVVAVAVGLIVIKAAITVPLVRLFGFSRPVAIETGLVLAPGGEFAFVVVGLALGASLLDAQTASLVLAATAISMALIPALDWAGRRLGGRLAGRPDLPPEAAVPPPDDHLPRVLLIGGGRVGRLVAELLARRKVPHLIVDRDPRNVARLRRDGREAYFGDATQAAFLDLCGLAEATAMVITLDQRAAVDQVIAAVRERRPDLAIVARAHDAGHAVQLYKAGVTDAVPETIEAGLQLSEAALVAAGVAAGHAIAEIHEKRDEFRAELLAASRAGAVRGVRAPRSG
jgi:CPA2 family monovalent cation:H+ antiporter-2